MAVDPGDPDVGQGRGLPVDPQGIADVDAELVLLEPGGDVGMGAGVHVRIDPQGIGATRPRSPATASSRSSSPSDSRLKQRISSSRARRISSARLPTPEKITLDGSPPAARTRSSSPTDTMSKPEPRRARQLSTARLELALTAKQIRWGWPAKAVSKARHAAPGWPGNRRTGCPETLGDLVQRHRLRVQEPVAIIEVVHGYP